MKKNILVAAAFALLWTTGCEQKKASEDLATTEAATEAAPMAVVNNPNTTNPEEIATSADAPAMTFTETTHDFGTIKEGEVVNHIFAFKNTGKSPLVIESASSTCGCTVPEVPKEPIAPGAEGKISVQFNSAGKGGTQQMKVISIKANTQPEITQVNIKANVAAAAGANGPLAQ
ncbi:MAG: hypothetical protein COW65_12200 [Cytophagales bacterium CG18_big_fil_WC_8_21_14_2_50_42_9]|nr:MAG: hypothetical protein COW65_12200 [Cytophagales bacterium CG18_big_fil_WC_8_21_14_2_50_42_9]